MSSWFDEFEKSQPDTVPVDEDAQVDAGVTRASSGREVGREARTTIWLIPVLVVILVIAAWAGWYLVSAGNDIAAGADEESAQAGSSSSVVEMAPVNPDTQVAVAGQCEPQEGETSLSTGDTTLRGTISKWQDAYYSQDAEALGQYLTPESWMNEQDWAAILPEAAPEGTSWCAVMAPVEDSSVDVDLMVTFADGSSQTYQQTVVGAEGADGAWLIDDILTR
ncbi:hypothetical protein [Corynebacterium mayonis]|uniref:hypothetical protein n=1 Tax=Corynebacterium mayonis TaxID=3062461 RepID=UPI0031402F8E